MLVINSKKIHEFNYAYDLNEIYFDIMLGKINNVL
jgi:hypothetical protein